MVKSGENGTTSIIGTLVTICHYHCINQTRNSSMGTTLNEKYLSTLASNKKNENKTK